MIQRRANEQLSVSERARITPGCSENLRIWGKKSELGEPKYACFRFLEAGVYKGVYMTVRTKQPQCQKKKLKPVEQRVKSFAYSEKDFGEEIRKDPSKFKAGQGAMRWRFYRVVRLSRVPAWVQSGGCVLTVAPEAWHASWFGGPAYGPRCRRGPVPH